MNPPNKCKLNICTVTKKMEGKARSKQTASNITLDDLRHRSKKYNMASVESNRGVKCRMGVVAAGVQGHRQELMLLTQAKAGME